MKKALIIISIILALGSVALFVLHLQSSKHPEAGPTTPVTQPEQTVPTTGEAADESTAPEAPEYTFPQGQPLPSGTQPTESDGTAPVPTAAPGLDEDETPHMEI